MHVSTLVRVTVPIVVFAGAVPAAAGVEEAKLVARRWVDANAESLKRVNKAIWTHAEVGLKETHSAQELVSLMRANGFRVEMGVAGMPTAFVARCGSGTPGDRHPGRVRRAARAVAGCGPPRGASAPGADAGPRLRPQHLRHRERGRRDRGEAGPGRGGRSRAPSASIGTPAEETLIGKVYMLREGLFNDVGRRAHVARRRHDHGGLRLLEGDGLGQVPLQGPARARLGLAARGQAARSMPSS